MGKGKAGEGKFVILVSEKLVGPGELVEGEWRNARARARTPVFPTCPSFPGRALAHPSTHTLMLHLSPYPPPTPLPPRSPSAQA